MEVFNSHWSPRNMQVILDVCGLIWLTVERLKPKSKTSSASCGQRSRHFLGKDDLERLESP